MGYGDGFLVNQNRGESQTVLSDPVEILSTTDTEGAIPDTWVGHFQMTLYTAGSDAVQLEKLETGTTGTWVVARYKGDAIEMDTAGDTFDIHLTRGDTYRLVTTTAGAKVGIMSHG